MGKTLADHSVPVRNIYRDTMNYPTGSLVLVLTGSFFGLANLAQKSNLIRNKITASFQREEIYT